MARLRIIDTTGGSGPFSSGGSGTTVTIDLDEALPTEDFQIALGTFVVAAQTIIRSLDGEDDTESEPVLPAMVVVPDDQIQAIADLNSGIDRPAGLLIIPASAHLVNTPWNDAPLPSEGADEPLNPDEPAPDLDPEQHFGNEPGWTPEDRVTFPVEDHAGTEAGCA